MKIINNEVIKGVKIGEFGSGKCFEVIKNSYCGWDVEIKFFGLHLRWYPGRRFFFIRKLA